MLRKFAIVALLGMFCASLVACNTTEGAGEDLEQAGQGVQNVAE